MATRREMGLKANTDLRQLLTGWNELYDLGTDEATQSSAHQDMYHIPTGMRDAVDSVLEEGVEYINTCLANMHQDGELSEGEETFDAAMKGMFYVSRMIAWRFFKLGQHVSTKLPYQELTPCPCTTLVDDELAELLSSDFDLEGEGWVIKSFDSNWKAV